MALMILLRLPTERELERAGVEAHTFLDEFNKSAVAPFVAKVQSGDQCAILNEWRIANSDWFRIVTEETELDFDLPRKTGARYR